MEMLWYGKISIEMHCASDSDWLPSWRISEFNYTRFSSPRLRISFYGCVFFEDGPQAVLFNL